MVMPERGLKLKLLIQCIKNWFEPKASKDIKKILKSGHVIVKGKEGYVNKKEKDKS